MANNGIFYSSGNSLNFRDQSKVQNNAVIKYKIANAGKKTKIKFPVVTANALISPKYLLIILMPLKMFLLEFVGLQNHL